MNLDNIKKVVEGFMSNAQILLGRDHCIHPVLFALGKNDLFTPTMINSEQGDQAKLKDLMKELVPVSQALILLMDANLKLVNKADAEAGGINLLEDPEAYTAILALVYTKKDTATRQIIYVRDDEHFSYSYEKWTSDNPLERDFPNPFIKE